MTKRKGFRRSKDPSGQVHSNNARGIKNVPKTPKMGPIFGDMKKDKGFLGPMKDDAKEFSKFGKKSGKQLGAATNVDGKGFADAGKKNLKGFEKAAKKNVRNSNLKL